MLPKRLISAARAAWPTIEVPEEMFRNFLNARVTGDVAPARVSELYLTCACAQQDPRAIELFQLNFLADLGRVLSRLEPSMEFIDDVRQQLMQHWFVPRRDGYLRISEYSGSGPLQSWVRKVAMGTALNLLRKGHRELADEEEMFQAVASADDAELDLIRARYRNEFKQALGAALGRLTSRDRNVLRLHYLSGMSLDQLATAYQVHRATIARWLASARMTIVQESRKLLTEQLKLSGTELESAIRIVRSDLDLSLTRLLRERSHSG